MPKLQELLEIVAQIRARLKAIKEKYRDQSTMYCYDLIKNLHSQLKQLLTQEDKLPQFYEGLHDVTVRMRKDLLSRLRDYEIKNSNMQIDFEKVIGSMQNVIGQREKQIKQLQNKIQHIGLLNDFRGEGNTIMLKIENQNRNLRDQNKKLQKEFEKLETALTDKDRYIKEINKQLQDRVNTSDKVKGSSLSSHQKHNDSNYVYEYGLVRDTTDFPNLKETNNSQNVSESSQGDDKRVRSLKQTNKKRQKNGEYDEDAWRFIYLQALAIQQMIEQDSQSL